MPNAAFAVKHSTTPNARLLDNICTQWQLASPCPAELHREPVRASPHSAYSTVMPLKTRMAKFNLDSPTCIRTNCDLADLPSWFSEELNAIENTSVRSIVRSVSKNLSDFVQFPERAVLLWHGCDRVPNDGQRQKYHRYPAEVRQIAKSKRIQLDSRPNGPAIASFLVADGIRPNRTGSSNAWSIHHLYSGKFPYIGKTTTTHAQKETMHFTQSAGLIAAHPIADAISDEFPCFTWLLRAEAFQRFGYDPDRVFAHKHNVHGFAQGHKIEVAYKGA